MPELAEVETVRRVLKENIVPLKITDIKYLYPKIVENTKEEFDALINQHIIDVSRKGKYLIFETTKNYLISHLRMEGKYYLKNNTEEITKHEHILIYLDDLVLSYHDTRKFGRMKLIEKEELETYFLKLGPEPKDLTFDYLKAELISKNKPVKTLLLEQNIIAGLGNIYVNEVLFASKINPNTVGKDLTDENIYNIIKTSKSIIDKAIIEGGCTIKSYTSQLGVKGNYQNFLKVHMKDNIPCEVCNSIILKTKIGGRGTYYCPNCQK